MKNLTMTNKKIDEPHELLNADYTMTDNKIHRSGVGRALFLLSDAAFRDIITLQTYAELQHLRIQELKEDILILKQEITQNGKS
jgi:hypothetical protein